MTDYPSDQQVQVRRGGVLDALHALFGAMPVAYFLLAFLFDLTYVRSAYWIWPIFSVWLITAGLVAGGIAVVVGAIDWLVRRRSSHGPGFRWHSLLTVVALLLGLLNAFVHSRDGWTAVVPEGIILSGVTTLLMIVVVILGLASARRAVA